MFCGLPTGGGAERELTLIKIAAAAGPERTEVMQLADIFRARIVDVSDRSITLCVTGDAGKVRLEKYLLGSCSSVGKMKGDGRLRHSLPVVLPALWVRRRRTGGSGFPSARVLPTVWVRRKGTAGCGVPSLLVLPTLWVQRRETGGCGTPVPCVLPVLWVRWKGMGGLRLSACAPGMDGL
jgi:Small subunit of acetolactate synthase